MALGAVAGLLLLLVVARVVTVASDAFPGSCLYVGRVRHTRLKGGAVHAFQYPIFFSFIDLDEIDRVGWGLWPIFKVNGGWGSFCSLDYSNHLRDWDGGEEEDIPSSGSSTHQRRRRRRRRLADHARSFVRAKTQGTAAPNGPVKLLAHLTYFGYCFNPISIFYFLRGDKDTPSSDSGGSSGSSGSSGGSGGSGGSGSSGGSGPTSAIENMVVEVSNTPWIEQHSYMLNESVPGVTLTRDCDGHGSWRATWPKAFHVSPFMEMDYRYDFTFSEPGRSSSGGIGGDDSALWVRSQLVKEGTGEVWFTANFELRRLAFTPLNLLYVLVFYPLHTRTIQVLIHWKAVKLFWKGVPTFEHPNGADVDFGFGVTGKRLGAVIWVIISPLYYIHTGKDEGR